MTQPERRSLARWLAWEPGCLGYIVLLWFVVPAYGAFLALVFFSGVVSTWLYVVVIPPFVVAPLAVLFHRELRYLRVLFTATFGYLRAKKVAAERELRAEGQTHARGGDSTVGE